MDKQEAALTAWLSTVLVPAKTTEDGPASRALAAGRMAAKARGLLWHLYSSDDSMIATMLKVEKHIDAGQLRLRDEVCNVAHFYATYSSSTQSHELVKPAHVACRLCAAYI